MDCPRCSGVEMEEMSLEDETVIRQCSECSSIWMDTADLTRLLVHNNLTGLDALGGRENLEDSAGTCPEDLIDLVVIQSVKDDSLSYAMCEICGGLWLAQRANGSPFQGETGEALLDEVIAFFGAFAAPNRARV